MQDFKLIIEVQLCNNSKPPLKANPSAVNLNDYEQKFFPTYKAFAETIRNILEKALQQTISVLGIAL